jgi:4-hydroxy-tetrahydrodipicolinate synthase
MNTDKPTRPEGIIAAAATAMTSDFSVDMGRTTAHWFRLLDSGCHALAVFGTTGEANSLGVAERMATLEAAVKTGVPVERLWPGTGSCALPDAIDLTRHALELGVPGVLVLPPFYYKQVDDEGLADWYSTLIDNVGHARLSLILYHFPQLSGIPITPGLIDLLLKRHPRNITGIKDSTGDLDSALGFRRAFPELAILPGADPLLLPLLEQGGAGCITAIANVASPLLRLIWDHHADPAGRDRAETAHAMVCDLRDALAGPNLVARIKATLARTRDDPEWGHTRPPLRPLTPEQTATLWSELEPTVARMNALIAE